MIIFAHLHIHMRNSSRFLKLKYPLSVDDSTFIVEKLLAFVNSSEVDMHSQTKALTACAMLLTYVLHHLLVSYSFFFFFFQRIIFLSKRKDLKLQIDWKPLYDRLAALQTQSRSLGFAGKQIRGYRFVIITSSKVVCLLFCCAIHICSASDFIVLRWFSLRTRRADTFPPMQQRESLRKFDHSSILMTRM